MTHAAIGSLVGLNLSSTAMKIERTRIMKTALLLSTSITSRLVAYSNVSTPFYNSAVTQQVIAAAEAAANQQTIDIASVEEDLSKPGPDNNLMIEYWDLTDDIIEGFQRIKEQGCKYLPKFRDENQNDFENRLSCAEFTNIYSDIVEGLAGKPFQEPIKLVESNDKETHPEIESFIKDVDGTGNNITSFAASTFFNGINSAITWIYVDYPKTDRTQIRTLADAKTAGIRPFWSFVLGRNVLEANSEIIGGEETLTYLRLLEPGNPNHVRIFVRTPDGKVSWALYEEQKRTDSKKTFIMIDAGPVTIGFIPFVPFFTGRRNGRSFRIFPAMRAVADMQIILYRQESGLSFTKTMSAYLMLAANGVAPEKGPDGQPKRVAIGPSKILYAPPDGNGNIGSWDYISPDAAVLTFLKNDIKDTMDQMRELGRQPLTAQSGNLTVITTAYAAGKAKTVVGAWAYGLKLALERALRYTALWLNISPSEFEPQVKIFDEYDDFTTDQAADLTALRGMRQDKDLSYEDYMKEMQRRDVLRGDFDAEENRKRLLDEVPSDNAATNEFGNSLGSNQPTKR